MHPPIFMYLLRHVSADNYGYHQVVSQLDERKYIELEYLMIVIIVGRNISY